MTPSQHHHRQPSDWATAHGGLRGSTSVLAGALLLAAGALVNLVGQLAGGPGGTAPPTVVMGGWLLWILGLAIAGWGLIWIAAGPVLSRLGIAPGLAHLAQSGLLLLMLCTQVAPPVPPSAIAVVRLALLAMFGLKEVSSLGRGTARLLALCALLQALKIGLRQAGLLPEPGLPVGPLVDAVLNEAVAVALFQAGQRVRQAEDRWARASFTAPVAGFEHFNNPDHGDLDRG